MPFSQSRTDNRLTSSKITIKRWSDDGIYRGSVDYTMPKTRGIYRKMLFNPTFRYKPGRFSVNPVEQVTCSIGSAAPESSSVPLISSYYTGCWTEYGKWLVGGWKGGTRVYGDLASYALGYANVGYPRDTVQAVYPSQRLIDNAILQSHNKINKEDFGTALFLAELSETIAMLRNPFQGFRKLYNEFILSSRKMSKTGRKNLADALSSQWMEYRYGIVPLIGDISSIIDLIEGKITKRSREMCKAKRRILVDDINTSTYSQEKRLDFSAWNVYYTYRERRSQQSAIVANTFYRRKFDFAQLFARLGLSPDQLITIPWELIPLSFVVDWVVGVGDWLQSIVPLIGVDLLGNTVSYRVTQKCTITGLYLEYYTDGRFTKVPAYDYNATQTIESYVRLANVPMPALPVLQTDVLNLKRSLDSVSLIWQNLPKLRRG